MNQPSCPPDPSTESCILKAGCGTRATSVSPWGWGSLSPTIKAELWGQLPWAEGRSPRSFQQPGRTTTQWAPTPTPASYAGHMWV